jgi:hypothetical protein
MCYISPRFEKFLFGGQILVNAEIYFYFKAVTEMLRMNPQVYPSRICEELSNSPQFLLAMPEIVRDENTWRTSRNRVDILDLGVMSTKKEGRQRPRGLFSFLSGGVLLLLLAITGCASPPKYTSLDLALLPCEQGDSPVFFRAIEFDQAGAPLFDHQVKALHERFEGGPPVTDLILFVHGWNKNPSSAELDYQNFLCRLHGRLRDIIGESKRRNGLLVLGVFWPSTITNQAQEPVLLKPLSYYQIRDRADAIAEAGLYNLLVSLTLELKERRAGVPVRLHLIGHSFGARMLVRSLEKLSEENQLVPFLQAAGNVNVVLVNAAMPPSRFDWISKAVTAAKRQKTAARFTEETKSYLFNVHSFNDTANRVLFRLASLFNDDPATCAAGACGVPDYETLCVDNSGKPGLQKVLVPPPDTLSNRLNAWNVDATPIVFAHSDIYKGRMATLLAELLYKRRFPERPLPEESDPLSGDPKCEDPNSGR